MNDMIPDMIPELMNECLDTIVKHHVEKFLASGKTATQDEIVANIKAHWDTITRQAAQLYIKCYGELEARAKSA